MGTITLITGGQRSGKSSFAQKLALRNSDNPIYLATARVWDKDFEARIKRHQSDRGENWQTIEEEKFISKLNLDNRTVLLDCITLWLNNFFYDNKFNVDKAFNEAKSEWDLFIDKKFDLIVVTNEIGMGVHPENETSRKFADIQGWMNQHIASKSENAFFMVSGIPVKIK